MVPFYSAFVVLYILKEHSFAINKTCFFLLIQINYSDMMKKNFYTKTKALLLSCMLSAFSLNSMAADITTGRILHYDFNAVSGTVVSDVSGNSLDGTTYGSPAGMEGKEGNALNFPTVDDYMTAPAGLLSDVTDFSFATWVNISTLNQWSRIFDFGNDTNNYLFLTPRSGAGKLRFAVEHAPLIAGVTLFFDDVAHPLPIVRAGPTTLIHRLSLHVMFG